jgi:hypothetical protein
VAFWAVTLMVVVVVGMTSAPCDFETRVGSRGAACVASSAFTP